MKKFLSNNKGLSGISTLIIFIAIILVAAVAAMVLLQTVGSLQSQALATGKESKQQVSTNLQVVSVTGYVAESEDINYLRLTVSLAPGSGKVGLADTVLGFNDGTNIRTGVDINLHIGDRNIADAGGTDNNNSEQELMYFISAASEYQYDVRWLGETDSYTSGDISPGQLVELWYNCPDLAPDTDAEVEIHPASGTSTTVYFTTPTSYDSNYIPLYP